MARTIVGTITGLVVGYVLTAVVFYISGNLFMPEPEYQKRRLALACVFWLIEGLCGFLGGLWGFRASKKVKNASASRLTTEKPGRKSKLENETRDDRRFFGLK